MPPDGRGRRARGAVLHEDDSALDWRQQQVSTRRRSRGGGADGEAEQTFAGEAEQTFAVQTIHRLALMFMF